MKSEFCQWCTELQRIANKDGVIIEAQMFDLLDYLFRTGVDLEESYTSYVETKQRINAISSRP